MLTGANCGTSWLVVLLVDEEEQFVLSVPDRLSAFTKARQIDGTTKIPSHRSCSDREDAVYSMPLWHY